jgi:hypothetical protein
MVACLLFLLGGKKNKKEKNRVEYLRKIKFDKD